MRKGIYMRWGGVEEIRHTGERGVYMREGDK